MRNKNEKSGSLKDFFKQFLSKASSDVVKNQEEFMGKESRRIRLVIAIPAIMILLTLAAGLISYQSVIEMANHAEAESLKTRLEAVATNVLVVNLIACGVAAIFGIGLATYITRPIRAIAQQIASGDLTMKLNMRYHDELGELGDSYNSFIDHLNNLFKERDRYILEGFVEGLISVGEKGTIMALNTQAERILGLKAEKLIGSRLLNIIQSLKDNRIFNDYIDKSIHSHERTSLDRVNFTNSRGNRFTLSLTTSPIKDRHGKWMGCIITMRDLAFLASFTEQIRKADRLAAIGSFSTGIAHELRNPLGSIKGVAQILSEKSDEAFVQEYTQMIVGEVDRLDKVIRTLLNFAQPDTENIHPTDLNSILKKALHLSSHNSSVEDRLNRIKIREEYGQILPCNVQPNRLTQAFSNIILNALHFVKDRGTVAIQSRMMTGAGERKFVELRIANDGPPINPDVQDKIFEPFFTTRNDGTGLGLPIAYQIITSNGGGIEVLSKNGKTTFIIRFPVLPRELIKDAILKITQQD